MTTRIAIDCMEETTARLTVPAAIQFLADRPAAHLILVGQEGVVRPFLVSMVIIRAYVLFMPLKL